MTRAALDAVRVTADRVRRFSADVERDRTDAARARWRSALEDLTDVIRRARADGHGTSEIRAATGVERPGRFVRAPDLDRDDAAEYETAAG